MEYLKLTNGTVTVKVVKQTNEDNAAWPFQIMVKTGTKHFQDVNSTTKLESAIEEAVQLFRNKTYFEV
jgi:hypothetical protein